MKELFSRARHPVALTCAAPQIRCEFSWLVDG
jgi:hypothetical protein